MNLKAKYFFLTTLFVASIFFDSCSFYQRQGEVAQSLPRAEEFIIFNKYNVDTDQTELWAINPNSTDNTLIRLGYDLYPWSLSPSGKQWLFSADNSIYVSDSDGSNLRKFYSNNEYSSFNAFWMSDDVILFNAFRDVYSPPDIYSLDINTNTSTLLFPNENQFVQATFPSDNTWLRANWSNGSLVLVHQNGDVSSFFDDFSILTDYFNRNQVEKIYKLDQYLVSARASEDADYKLWLLSDSELPQMLFDPGDGGINYFRLSPNGRYLGVIYLDLKDTYIVVLDVKEQQLLYQWICPYEIGNCDFVWSPDSKSIALFYSETDLGVSSQINSGIQIMNITTGAIRVVLRENVIRIIEWRFVK